MTANGRAFDLLELRKKLLLIFWGDAVSGIDDAQGQSARVRRERRLNLNGALIGELHGVAGEVEKNLAQLALVGPHAQPCRSLRAKGEAFFHGEDGDRLADILEKLRDLEILRMHRHHARVELGRSSTSSIKISSARALLVTRPRACACAAGAGP